MQGSVHCACADNLCANSTKQFPRTKHKNSKKGNSKVFLKKERKLFGKQEGYCSYFP